MPNQELHSLGAKEHKPTAKHWWATKASHFCWQQAKEGPKSLCPAPNHLYIGMMCPGQDVAAPEPCLPICSMPQHLAACLPFGATAVSAELHHMLPTVISWPHINQEYNKKPKFNNTFNTVRLFVPLNQNSLQLIMSSYLLLRCYDPVHRHSQNSMSSWQYIAFLTTNHSQI